MKRRNVYFREPFRPRFHYTAQSHTINDPNGLVYYEGEYHLMYQYNINNHIHWGHAVSEDLLHWKHLPPALAPDSIGQIWSGSAVVDWNNTSGLQIGNEKIMAAFFTYNEHIDAQQSQGLAYSSDRGRTWHKYENNPILTSQGKKDFRDPKVFWFAPEKCWIMVLACFDHVEFYRSFNMTEWKFSGAFGKGQGSHTGIWECPDLFPLPIKHSSKESQWVLVVSVNEGAPAGGTGMQYFIGDFDGFQFKNDNPPGTVLWLDYGKDFYAGVTWNDLPNERRLMIAWADNWLYRDDLPTVPFKGQFSTVRELFLEHTKEGIRLFQCPICEIEALRNHESYKKNGAINRSEIVILPNRYDAFDFSCQIAEGESRQGNVEIRLLSSEKEFSIIGYDFARELLYIDRTHSGMNPSEEFSGIHKASLQTQNGMIDIRILADTSQVEVFANNGAMVMTDLVFPERQGYDIEIHANETAVKLEACECFELAAVWNSKHQTAPLLNIILSGNWAETVSGLEGDCDKTGILVTADEYTDFSFDIKIKILPFRSNKCVAILFGIDNEGMGYKLILDVGNKCICLYYKNMIHKKIDFSLNQERVYHLAVMVKNRNLSVCVDGVEMIHQNIMRFQAGRLGLCIDNTTAFFNDIQILDLS